VSLHVVLVEPAGPLNLGSVARLCANFAVSGLRLVAPRCDPQAPEARRMAVHGLPLLEGARLFPTLAAALADCGRIVATTGRDEGAPLPLLPPAEALAWLVAAPPSPAQSPAATALVFGREDRGLTNQELLQAGRLLRIGTGPAYASLNLSHAVAVVLHELHQLRRDPSPSGQVPRPAPLPPITSPAQDPCQRDLLEAALADAEALLLEVGFLLPHTSRARMAKLRALLQRGEITAAEVALLRGMVCQLRWASRRGVTAADAP
jgi:tRNA/rRNA methyltransferase